MPPTRLARVLLTGMVALLALAPSSGHPLPVAAASLSFTVNSTADAPDANPGDGICADSSGQCTLRAAIQEADAQPSGSSITIDVPAGTYGLTLGTLQLTANRITISGALSSTTIISGNNTSTLMSIASPAHARLGQLTLKGGNVGTGNGGGLANQGVAILSHSMILSSTASSGAGIYNTGTLIVTGVTVSGNSATQGSIANLHGTLSVSNSTVNNNTGGGIYNTGTVTVTNSTFSRNSGGGGIYNGGTATLTSSIFSANIATNGGGGVLNGGTLIVTNSTFSRNMATSGGGIGNDSMLTVTNSTFSGNSATKGYGGGISNIYGGTLTVTSSMFSGNSAHYGGGIDNGGRVTVISSTLSGNSAHHGGGIDNHYNATIVLTYNTIASNSDGINNFNGMVALTGTILANSSGPNCSGPMVEGQGYNLDSGTSCGFSQSTDITNTDPLLGPLANNGGPTQTMALLPGSPAIDHGGTSATGCPATDQRGMPRPDEAADSGACDMGAFESQGTG